MHIRDLHCCAIREIVDISSVPGGPERVMKSICQFLSIPVYARLQDGRTGYTKGLAPKGLYLFTGVVKSPKSVYHNEHVEDMTYGPALAAYIKANKLGSITESPAKYNLLAHPTHKVKVWVWGPHVENLTKWWEEHKPKPVGPQ